MIDKVFIDTSFLKAVVDEKDDFYTDALRIWNRFREGNFQLLTSNFILDETLTLVRIRRGLHIIELFRKILAGKPAIEIERVALEDEENAWKWFMLPWKDLSFTDCISFALMKRLGLNRVATFDKHFRQAGFILF
ncbi:PIN domain-containing protein [Candidatus Gottesmanbacteria bacterium]|nr:PIN domain-containing protein [Candidatus Gottesmanbacteria bacterium]